MLEFHQLILDNLNEVIHLVDENMNILFANKSIEKLSRGKIKKEEMIGRNLYDIFPFLEEKGINKEYEKVFSTGKILKTEEWTQYHGEKIFTSTTKIPVKDEKGRVKQVITIMRDITDLKKTEEVLKEMVEKYSKIIELAQEGICIDDENEITVFVNDAFAKNLGYKKDELIGKSIFDLVDEKGKKILHQQIKNRKKGESSRYEITVYRKDEEPRILLISATPLIVNGKYKGSISVNLDITERKKMEETIKMEREQLLSIFEGIDEPIYVADPKTYEILYVNKALKELFGDKDIIGKKCYKIFQNLNEPCDFCTNDKILGKNFGKTYAWEWQNLANKRWYRCIDKGIKWPDGREVRFEIAIDITERKKAEEKMKKLLEKEMEFKLRTSHYFFNPICIAKGFLELAKEEDGIDKIDKALKAIDRIEKVVKNIITKGEIKE
ncbi:MAG TPA: PAS domain S-box protein [Thermoplasmatales archaeon]|nr:PAS domain S-box protein [Thermoplasmatales archaeon]